MKNHLNTFKVSQMADAQFPSVDLDCFITSLDEWGLYNLGFFNQVILEQFSIYWKPINRPRIRHNGPSMLRELPLSSGLSVVKLVLHKFPSITDSQTYSQILISSSLSWSPWKKFWNFYTICSVSSTHIVDFIQRHIFTDFFEFWTVVCSSLNVLELIWMIVNDTVPCITTALGLNSLCIIIGSKTWESLFADEIQTNASTAFEAEFWFVVNRGIGNINVGYRDGCSDWLSCFFVGRLSSNCQSQ